MPTNTFNYRGFLHRHVFDTGIRKRWMFLNLVLKIFQAMLDALCPTEVSSFRRRLCAIFITEDREEDDEAREQLRQLTREFKYSRERIAFTYIYLDKQTEFLNALCEGN